MVTFALLVGFYSYLILFLGVTGLLYKSTVIVYTMLFWGSVLWWKRNDLMATWEKVVRVKKRLLTDRLVLILFFLFVLQALVNLIGALGPELSFDAVWYHLTLPKLSLQNHIVEFIPGGLLYYSAMPKLGEMLYIAGLSFGEMLPKLIHFSFGVLTSVVLYQFSRKFFTPGISLLAVVIWYANLVVGWESTTAYIDLIRAFFEVLSLWVFVIWWDTHRRRWLVISGVLLGLAITTKLLAFASLVIFLILIAVGSWRSEKNLLKTMRNVGLYLLCTLAVPLPWFVFAFVYTGNPVYPFFSELYSIAPEPFSLVGFVKEIWILFTQAADPISPIYLIFLPLLIFFFAKLKKEMKVIAAYSLLAILLWYFTPRTGGGRFILPYLPAFSLLCAAIVAVVSKEQKRFAKLLIGLIIVVSVISIGYRFAANYKYLPVLVGFESKHDFLTNHLNYSYGDFYDTDHYFADHIQVDDRVLLYGFHNLYYIDFPFVDSSWVKKGEQFNYIATQNTQLPERFSEWKLVYENKQTMVKLYQSSACQKKCSF